MGEEKNYTEECIDELKQDHLRFEEIAKTHLIKGDFYWILGTFITILIIVFGFLSSTVNSHIKEDDLEFSEIQDKHVEFQITYTKIQEHLMQIQKELVEIKLNLKEHDGTK